MTAFWVVLAVLALITLFSIAGYLSQIATAAAAWVEHQQQMDRYFIADNAEARR